MKRLYLYFLLIILLIPTSTKALTETEARKAITDYAYYVYNEKKSEISYVSPNEVNQEKIFLGYKTQNNTYAMDCNAFVGFVVYNAFQLKATDKGKIEQPASGDGYLNSSGRVALNGIDGWSSHSSLYDSKRYPLKAGETIQKAVSRIDLESKLNPGDLIAVVGFSSSSYNDLESSNKSAHIMIYVGDGKYIHNKSSGVSLDSISSISYGSRVGSTFPDSKGNTGPHGAITVLTLVNYEQIPSSILNKYRFPDGNGNLVITKTNQENNDNNNNGKTNPIKEEGHWEHVSETLHFCEREDTAKLVRLFNLFIQIIRVVVPIILIISLMLELTKAITNPDQFNVAKKNVVTKIVTAVLIFLVPTFVNIITNIAGFEVNYSSCLSMSKNPKKVNIWVDVTPDDDDNNDNGNNNQQISDNNDIKVEKKGVYIKLTTNNVAGYYFSNKKENLSASSNSWISSSKNTIDFILLPGSHYIYAKTKDGKIYEKSIEVKASDIVITAQASDISMLTTGLDEFLRQHNSSLEEFNASIARSVAIAGEGTKAGASAASLALTQILYTKYKVKIPYGKTKGTHIVVGAPSTWGSPDVSSDQKKQGFTNQGIHCGGFVSWSYTQSNFTMSSGIGSSAQLCRWGYASIKKISNTSKGEVGDVITLAKACDESQHVAVINAIDENGYYLTESNVKTKTVNDVRKVVDYIGIVTSYDTFDSRWKSYLDMSSTIKSKKKSVPLEKGF